MTIEELRAKKVSLSSGIHELIRTFEDETGLTVDRVELHHGLRIEPTPILMEVKLTVEI